MQARMQAVSTWLACAAKPLGALLAGGLGTWVGVRPALVVGSCLLLVPFMVLARSPVRGLRQMPNMAGPPDTPCPVVPAPGAARAKDVSREGSMDGGTP
ncbi:hypothetical protein Sspor_15360 [Streptomyces spororaveus]|uniref:Uncharacterized protein n=1 Tax=Streptomyces spororaveus TaxID=284039 RepID=A0ABQ3T7I4_9ACTN|nr:hypothetical protein Sspor_15360 [Streptomyces spororaveus]